MSENICHYTSRWDVRNTMTKSFATVGITRSKVCFVWQLHFFVMKPVLNTPSMASPCDYDPNLTGRTLKWRDVVSRAFSRCGSKLRSWLVQGNMWKMCRKTLGFYPQKQGRFQPVRGCVLFFFQGQAATCLLNKGIVRKVRSLSLQLVGRKLRVLAVRKTPSFEGQFRIPGFEGQKTLKLELLKVHTLNTHIVWGLKINGTNVHATGCRLKPSWVRGAQPAFLTCEDACESKPRDPEKRASICLFMFVLLCFAFAVLCFPYFLLTLVKCPAVSPLLANGSPFTCRRNDQFFGVGPEDLARAV